MAVRLRLAHFGKKHAPFYRVVAIDSRKMRDGEYLDNLGTYNPANDEYIQFHVERIEEWISKGAIPSDSVKKLYKRFKKNVQEKAVKSTAKVVKPVKVEENIEVEAVEVSSAKKAEKEAAVVASVEAEEETTKA